MPILVSTIAGALTSDGAAIMLRVPAPFATGMLATAPFAVTARIVAWAIWQRLSSGLRMRLIKGDECWPDSIARRSRVTCAEPS